MSVGTAKPSLGQYLETHGLQNCRGRGRHGRLPEARQVMKLAFTRDGWTEEKVRTLVEQYYREVHGCTKRENWIYTGNNLLLTITVTKAGDEVLISIGALPRPQGHKNPHT